MCLLAVRSVPAYQVGKKVLENCPPSKNSQMEQGITLIVEGLIKLNAEAVKCEECIMLSARQSP